MVKYQVFICFVFFCLLYFLERIHDTEHYFPMFLITRLSMKLYFVKIIVRFFVFFVKNENLTGRHCVRKCRFRLKKKKSIVKDNRDVFFWAQKCTKIFRWWEKKNCNPGYLRCFPFSENLDTIPLWCASGFKCEKKAIRLCDEEIS